MNTNGTIWSLCGTRAIKIWVYQAQENIFHIHPSSFPIDTIDTIQLHIAWVTRDQVGFAIPYARADIDPMRLDTVDYVHRGDSSQNV